MPELHCETITFPSSDGRHTSSAVLYTMPDKPVRAVIQLSHGMCEYVRRYAPMAEFYAAHGIALAGNDHLGHGDTAKAESCLASSLSEDAKAMIVSSIPQGATVSIEGMDQSMTETTAKVKASLSKGGEQEYIVKFVRSDNHIGWAVSSLDIDFSAADNQ